jgi:hypothetical protein
MRISTLFNYRTNEQYMMGTTSSRIGPDPRDAHKRRALATINPLAAADRCRSVSLQRAEYHPAFAADW